MAITGLCHVWQWGLLVEFRYVEITLNSYLVKKEKGGGDQFYRPLTNSQWLIEMAISGQCLCSIHY